MEGGKSVCGPERGCHETAVKGHTPREAKDNLKSTQLLSVIDAISEGPIEGPVDGLKSVLLNSTPVLDSEGNTNISGVTVVFRAGEQEQTPPEGFESSGSETVLGTEVKYDTPITRTITSANIDRLRFTFGVQALVETTSKGDRNPSEVRLLVQIQRNGGWVTEKDITIKGKTTSQYLASVVVDNLPPRPFNIRMRRMTPDSTTDQLQNKTLWSSYTEIIDVKQGYPNTALVGVQVDSEQFGSQQVSRNYHLRGRILQVPSNYDPEKRTYSGIWDGTLKPAYSNNIAWCLWDMLTHPRYGMGKRLGAADVDKWALYVIGQYCDQSVPDGSGGTEPRITCNAYLTTQRKAWDVLSDFCSAMRCMPVWNGQTLTFVQDRPSDNGAHFDGDQSGTVNGVTPPAVQHLTAEVTADSGEYQVLARWDTPKVVKGVSFLLRLTVAADDGSERLVSTARTAETTYRFTQLALGNYRLTVRAVNAWGQQGDPASVSFRIAAPAAPSRIELTPGYFQITATPHLAVYDPTVQFEFWFSEKRIADIRQVETAARYLGSALYWIAASINIKPGHDYYFYIRSVNTVGKSAFVEAVGRASDDAEGYLDFFKGEIGKTHLAQELWTQIDNGQLAPDLAEIRTSITDVSNEITQTVNKKLEDQSAAIQQIQKVQVDTNNNLNSMWAVKLQQMQDGRLYIAGIGAGIENTPDGMQSQVLLAADRIAMINPANGNTKPMFVGQGDQIFMNEVFLKRLTAPTITSGGNPPVFSLTPDGRLTAKNADISGNVNANSGTLNNVTINENCRVLGKLSANQIEGDLVKTVGKAFPRDSRAPERWPSGTITVRVYDDQPFDRQIVIPAVAFSGAKHERENNDIYSSCRLIVRKNGAEIYNRTALDNTLIYSGVIDMPAGHGHMTLEFSVSAWLVNNWYPTASISDLLVVVMKKATAGITIS
ncbi:host specificity protein J [Escherichia coli]